MNVSIVCLILAAGSAPAAEPNINDAQLLRLHKKFPEADANGDGRLTREEWARFHASARLKRDMSDDEASVLDARYSRGPVVSPTHAEVAYGPHAEQKLNLWLPPPSARPAPLIVHIHGGGFIQGSKHDSLRASLHEKLASEGVAYASVQYRFQSKDHPLPVVLHGIARSIQFLRHKAGPWNLDPARVGAFGGSAGAVASAWLGMRDDLAKPGDPDPVLRESTRIQVAWAISAPATMDVWRWPETNPRFTADMIPAWIRRWGYDPNTDPDDPVMIAQRKDLHLPDHASPDDAAMVIYNAHFADNVAHNPTASKALHDACAKAGMDVALYMREITNNLHEAPDMFDWMILRLKSLASPVARDDLRPAGNGSIIRTHDSTHP